jgi:hypothetical protein
MNKRSLYSMLLIVPLLVGSFVTRPANPPAVPVPAAREAITGFSDIPAHGTAWVPEKKGQFKTFRPYGWGTMIKAKTVGDKWIHLPLVFPVYLDATPLKVNMVEFCAQPSAVGTAYPVRMDVWADTVKVYTTNITWWSDSSYHCYNYVWSTSTWYQDLGLSILLRFTNTSDYITMYKGWVRVVP